jgi:archaellum component FlaC
MPKKVPGKKVRKKLKKSDQKEIVLEEIKPDELEEYLLRRPEEELKEREKKLLERINSLENRLYELESSLNQVKRETSELRSNFYKLNENVEDVMKIYEVVAAQENPFVSISRITTSALERVNTLEEDVATLNSNLGDLQTDMRILIGREVNVDDIVARVVIGAF